MVKMDNQDKPHTDTISQNKPRQRKSAMIVNLPIQIDDATKNFPFFDDAEETSTLKHVSHNFDMTVLSDKEEASQEEEVERRRTSLRRNSISLPALQDLELEVLRQHHLNVQSNQIPEHHQSIASSMSGDDGISECLELTTEDERNKIPPRYARRKSGPVPFVRRPGGKEFDMDTLENEEYSPVNSVTSINSLASLLREKIQSIPTKIRTKPTDYKIKAFVGFLFLCIVFFVGFAYVMYHQQVLARSYFERIKFNKVKRHIRVFNSEGVEIINGHLGVDIKSKNAYPCLGEHLRHDGSVCLEWLNGARLYLGYKGENHTKCYSIEWQALTEDVDPKDCYDWSGNRGHWYGGGQSANLSWPLRNGSHESSPFITGDIKKHQWGNVLMRYFINSKAVAIKVDNETPLYLSINDTDKKEFCLKAHHDSFAYVNHITPLPVLKYDICTSTNMKTLHSSLSHHSLWDGLKPEDMSTLHSLLSEPVWQIAPRFKHELTEATIYNYTDDVIALGFLKQGHVLINEFWQDNIGDYTLDTERFQTFDQTVNVMHRRGFKIVFSIQPFISTESVNFAECVKNGLLISERFSDRRIPALSRYKSLSSAGVLDITNNRTIPWLQDKIKKLKDKYQIDSLYLDLGTAHNMPHYYQCEVRLTNPDQYKTLFTDAFEHWTSIIGVSSAVSLPRPPIFVSLPPFESTWAALRKVIPTILSYGVIGYPFLMPGAVGGDIDWPGNEQYIPGSTKTVETSNSTEDNGIKLPDKELYIRWLQLATFLPVMKFTHLPSKYNDEQVLEIAKVLTSFRQKTVTPLLVKYLKTALDGGLPLARPLWSLAPHDAAALAADDEFCVGDDLLVAPVLHEGAVRREVYLPAGVWKDGIDGSLRKGNRWIHDYHVPLDKVAYFLKMPDNTRF